MTVLFFYVILKQRKCPIHWVISTFGLKAARVSRLGRLYLSTHLLFLKYERTAITVQITVATQVTNAITISQVIRKPPLSLFRHKADRARETPPESGISNTYIIYSYLYSVNI